MIDEKTVSRLGVALLACFCVWAVCAWFDVGGQRTLFSASGENRLSDFWMPRLTLEMGYSARPDANLAAVCPVATWRDADLFVARHDRCYPAAALLPMKVFPLSDVGGWAWSGTCVVLYLLLTSLACRSLCPLCFVAAAPLAFAVALGNPILLSAGFAGVFLSGYRSPDRSRRIGAALALAVSASLKLGPAVLGVLYLPDIVEGVRRRSFGRVGPALLSFVAFAVLFFLPFAAMPDGFGGICDMLANAGANGRHYAVRAAFGLGPLVRTLQILLGQAWNAQDGVLLTLQHVGQIFGLAVLLFGGFRRDLFLVVGGFLFLTPNMMYYGLLYLLPVFVLEASGRRLRIWEAIGWFVMVCPLQLTRVTAAGVLSANGPLANFALLALVLGRLFHGVSN